MAEIDYAGNTKKDKEKKNLPDKKKVEKVVVQPVVVQKRSLGRKIRDLFIEADFKSVSRYVAGEVILPAIRSMLFDGLTKGGERIIYGEPAVRRRQFGPGPRITYNNPINRGYRDERIQYGQVVRAPRSTPRARTEDLILSSKEEAELVLERMQDIIDTYEVVSVADLNDLVGLPTTHVDNKWGWNFIGDVQIRAIREGYLIDLPQAEAIV
jgi:hypothetical protein